MQREQGRRWTRYLTRKRLLWILAGLFAIVVHGVFGAFPSLGEQLYGRGVYPFVRHVFAVTFGVLPFPAVVLVAVLAVILFVRTAGRAIVRKKWAVGSLLTGLLSTLGALIFLFQMLWGFNYSRPGIDERLGLDLTGMTKADLRAEFARATREMVEAFESSNGYPALTAWTSDDYEQSVHPYIEALLTDAGYRIVRRPRGRLIHPKGILMRWNTAGIYIPYSGEGHVDAGMLPVQIPFTMAHEMAHGYGVTDEGDCNFIAFLACRNSENADVRFSGLLSYWRYVASEFRYVFPEEYQVIHDILPQGVQDALQAIRRNNDLYPDLLPQLRDAVYDSYLKTQGVDDGLLSYSRVVRLAWAYENQKLRNTPE